jgi:hypothetical protein
MTTMIRAADLMGNVDGGSEMAEVSFDVYDIANRIQRGDESGWRGDPSASLMFNPVANRFEVWMVDAIGTPYVACSHDRCDHTLIVKLIEGDWQKGKALHDDLMKKNRAVRDAHETAEREKRLELADKLHWALVRDVGHLEGSNRRIHSMNQKGK